MTLYTLILTLALSATALAAPATSPETTTSTPKFPSCFQTCFNTAAADANCSLCVAWLLFTPFLFRADILTRTNASCYCESQTFKLELQACVNVMCTNITEYSAGESILSTQCMPCK